MSLQHSPSIVTNGLIVYLDAANPKSYPGTGTLWTDLSGQGNHGILINNPTYNSANNGNFVFNGNNNYAQIPTPINFTYNTFSVSCWVKTTAIGVYATILGQRFTTRALNNPIYDLQGWNFLIEPGGTTTTRIDTSTSYNSYPNIFGGIVNDNTWHYVCMVLDIPNTTIKYFNQGVLINSANTYSPGIFNSTGGAMNVMGPADGTSWTAGQVSLVQLYNRALSNQEVQQNFNALRGRYGI